VPVKRATLCVLLSAPMKRRDVNQAAYDVVQRAIGEAPRIIRKEESTAAKLGRKGGKKRAATLSKKKRSAIAAKAAKARWSRKKEPVHRTGPHR